MASIQHRTGQQVYRCQNASHTALDLQSHRSTCAKAVGLTYSSISKQECQRERDMHTSCLHHTVLSRSRHQHLCQDARASPCRFWTIHSPLSLPFSNLPTEEKKKEKKKKVFLFISPFFFSSLFHCLLTGTTYAIPKHFHSLLRPVFRWEMGGIYKHLYLSLYQFTRKETLPPPIYWPWKYLQILHLSFPEPGTINLLLPGREGLQIPITRIELLIRTSAADLTPSHTQNFWMLCTHLISSTSNRWSGLNDNLLWSWKGT